MQRMLRLLQKPVLLLLLMHVLSVPSSAATKVMRFFLRNPCRRLRNDIFVVGLTSSVIYRFAEYIPCAASSR